MKIFLSYASEQKAIAEPIAFSLRSRGHSVFLDRDDLPVGQSYDDQIHKAIETSDLMIFLITPESVTPGRYTLSELEHARRTWRQPANRVIPVMAVPTDYAAVPSFLKGVTILEPQGNLTAEVTAAVEVLRRAAVRLWRSTWRAAGLAALIAFLLIFGIAVLDALTGGILSNSGDDAVSNALGYALMGFWLAAPVTGVLWMFAAKRTWRAVLPVVLLMIAAQFLSFEFELLSKIDATAIGQNTPQSTAGTTSSGAETTTSPPAPELSPARRQAMDQIAIANWISQTVNHSLELLAACGLLTLLTIIGATLAAPELRSAWRWFVTLAIGTLPLTLLLLPIAHLLQSGKSAPATSEVTELQAVYGFLCIWAWCAIMGGLTGYWLARGHPSDPTAT